MNKPLLKILIAFLWLSIPMTVFGKTVELITSNDDFYNGSSSNWSISGDVNIVGSTFSKCNSCPGYAALGIDGNGYAKDHAAGTLKRTVTIPKNVTSGTSAVIGFYLYITTEETDNTVAYDIMDLTFKNSSNSGYFRTSPYSNKDLSSGYKYVYVTCQNIDKYAGQDMTITWDEDSDGRKPTTFRVDDVSVIVTVDEAADLKHGGTPALSAYTVEPGDNVTVYYELENVGDEDAGKFYTGFYLSSTSYLNGSSIYLERKSTSSLKAGSSTGSKSNSISIPSGTTSGDYYILVVADYDNEIDESDESNQVGFRGIKVETNSKYGNVHVDLYPQEAVDVGAQWRVDGGSWMNSDTRLEKLTVGTHFMEFKPVSGFKTPSNKSISIQSGSTLYEEATYVDNSAPELSFKSPKGGESFRVGEEVVVEVKINGNISSKRLFYSVNNGSSWTNLYSESTSNTDFKYSWTVPNLPSSKCLLRASVTYSGGTVEELSNTFEIRPDAEITYSISSEGLCHLRWPFYNSSVNEVNGKHFFSEWQVQHNFTNENTDQQMVPSDEYPSWYYSNTHGEKTNSDGTFKEWHHSGDKCFAQDWNVNPKADVDGKDCGNYFFSPIQGTLIDYGNSCDPGLCKDPNCKDSRGNFITVETKSIEGDVVYFRALHFKELNPSINWEKGMQLKAGTLVGFIGDQGSSYGSHVHIEMFKRVGDKYSDPKDNTDESITNRYNNVKICENPSGGLRAVDFRLDAITGGVGDDGGTTGLQGLSQLDVGIIPNPSNGVFKLVLNKFIAQSQTIEVTIYDQVGKQFFQKCFNNHHDLMSHSFNGTEMGLTTGMYIVSVRIESSVVHKKIVINN